MSEPERQADRDWVSAVVLAVAATVGIALTVMLVANALDPGEPDEPTQAPDDAVADAEPEPVSPAPVTPLPGPTPTAGAAPAESPGTPVPNAGDTRGATPEVPGDQPAADDRGRAGGPEPGAPTDLHRRLVDLDGDGQPERITAAIIAGTVEVEVATRSAEGYDAISTGRGGPADDLRRLHVEDFTGDGVPEVATRQWVAVSGESLAMWRQDRGELVPMIASGGCWDGSNVYGVTGVLVEVGRIVATCEREHVVHALWPADVYEWRNNVWAYTRTLDNRS